jgi:hypothetical protein
MYPEDFRVSASGLYPTSAELRAEARAALAERQDAALQRVGAAIERLQAGLVEAEAAEDWEVRDTERLAEPCCRDRQDGRSKPIPLWVQAMRTEIGRPSSSMRFRAWTATSTSVARRWSVRQRSPSPITCLNLPTVASTRARVL